MPTALEVAVAEATDADLRHLIVSYCERAKRDMERWKKRGNADEAARFAVAFGVLYALCFVKDREVVAREFLRMALAMDQHPAAYRMRRRSRKREQERR